MAPITYRLPAETMVGPGRVELPTSRLSGVRSNHLSYGPSPAALTQAPQLAQAAQVRGREVSATNAPTGLAPQNPRLPLGFEGRRRETKAASASRFENQRQDA